MPDEQIRQLVDGASATSPWENDALDPNAFQWDDDARKMVDNTSATSPWESDARDPNAFPWDDDAREPGFARASATVWGDDARPAEQPEETDSKKPGLGDRMLVALKRYAARKLRPVGVALQEETAGARWGTLLREMAKDAAGDYFKRQAVPAVGLARAGIGAIEAGTGVEQAAGDYLDDFERGIRVYEAQLREAWNPEAEQARRDAAMEGREIVLSEPRRTVGQNLAEAARVSRDYWQENRAVIERHFKTPDIRQNPEALLDSNYWREHGAQAVGSMAYAIGLGGGSTAAGAVIGGVMEAAPDYAALREDGMDRDEALARAAAIGAATAALNKIGLDKVFKGAPSARKTLADVVATAATEAATEWAEEPATAFLANVRRQGVDATELGHRVLQAMSEGLNMIAGAFIAGGGARVAQVAAERGAEAEAGKQQEEDAAVARVRGQNMRARDELRGLERAAAAEAAGVPTAMERGTEAGEAETQAQIEARIERDGLAGEMDGLLAELEAAQREAKTVATGRTAKRDEDGNRIDSTVVSVYPAGLDADVLDAMRARKAGRKLTDLQMGRLERAVAVAARRVDEAAQEAMGGAAPAEEVRKAQGEVKARDVDFAYERDGHRVERRTDGSWHLQTPDGEEVDLDPTVPQHRALIETVRPLTDQERGLVREEIAGAAQRYQGARVQVAATAAELPADVRETMQRRNMADEDVQGVMAPDGSIWIVADNVRPGQAARVLAEEVVVHSGLRQVLGGDAALDAVLRKSYLAGEAHQADLARVAEQRRLDMETEEGRAEALEELAADIWSRREADPGLWRRMVAALREALRGIGLVGEWSEGDIEVLVARAAERMREGPPDTGAEDGGARFAIKGTPEERMGVAVKSAPPAMKRGKGRFSTRAEITPEMDRAYLAAVERGDTETAQRMVDEAAKSSGYSVKAFHQTGPTKFNTFDTNRSYDGGLWFSSDRTRIERGETGAGQSGRIVSAWLKPGKVAGWTEYDGNSISELASKGYNSAMLDEDIVVFSPSQIKSSDSVTRDNSGRVILLSKRFNEKSRDMRFALPTEFVKAAQAAARARGERMRNPAARMGANTRIETEVREQIVEDPASYYTQQHTREHATDQTKMTDGELKASFDAFLQTPVAKLVNGANYGAQDGAELINRKIAARLAARASGDNAAVKALDGELADLWSKLMSMGTAVGQIEQQLTALKGSMPENVVEALEEFWAEGGRKVTHEQRRRLTQLAEAAIVAQRDLDTAREAMVAEKTEATVEAFDKQMDATREAQRRYQDYAADLTPKKWTDIIRTLRQGNMIRLTSQEVNAFTNLQMALMRDVGQNTAASADAVLGWLTERALGRARKRPGAPFVDVRGRVAGARKGVREAGKILLRGVEPIEGMDGEMLRRGFRPWHAFLQAIGKEEMLQRVDGDGVPVMDRVKKVVEALSGYPEIQFRMLAMGDIIPRMSRYEAVLREEGKRRGLKGTGLEVFVRAPDAETRRIAQAESEVDVYQTRGAAAQWIADGQRRLREAGDVGRGGVKVGDWIDATLVHPIVPFVTTPINVASIGAGIVSPAWSAARAMLAAGQVREARRQARTAKTDVERARAEARVRTLERSRNMWGSMVGIAIVMNAAAGALVRAGLATGREDDERKRRLQLAGRRPYAINTTAIRRGLTSGVWESREGDTWRSLLALGFFGLATAVKANQAARREAEGAIDAGPIQRAVDDWIGAFPELGKAMVEMTVLKGTETFLDALVNNRYDKLVDGWMRGNAAVVAPGMLEQLTRTEQIYLPDMTTERFAVGKTGSIVAEKAMAAIRSHNPLVDWAAAYPYVRDAFGAPVRRTPDGIPAHWYQMADFTRAAPISVAPVWREIGRVYDATRDVRAIPTEPSREMVVAGKSIALAPREYEEMVVAIGEERMRIWDIVSQGKAYTHGTPERQAVMMRDAWEAGLERGQRRWYDSKVKASGDLARKFEAARQEEIQWRRRVMARQ